MKDEGIDGQCWKPVEDNWQKNTIYNKNIKPFTGTTAEEYEQWKKHVESELAKMKDNERR